MGKEKTKNFSYMHITRKLPMFSVNWLLNFMNWQSTTQVALVTTQHAPHLKPYIGPSFQSAVPIHAGRTQDHALALLL